MALSDRELQVLRLRCQQAMAAGFGFGKGDVYAAELSKELGQKPPVKTTPTALLDLLDQVVAHRSGKLNSKPILPPDDVVEYEEQEVEEPEEPEPESEEPEEKPAPKPASKPKPKPKPASKPKPKPKKR